MCCVCLCVLRSVSMDLFVNSFSIYILNTYMPGAGDSAVTKADTACIFEDLTI